LPVIRVVCMTVPDLPWSAGRSVADVHVPVAVVAVVACIVKVSEIGCGLAAWAGRADAVIATKKMAAILVFI
jgi:hypothetical protein